MTFLGVFQSRKLIYIMCSRDDIDKMLLKLTVILNSGMSQVNCAINLAFL